jgi:hypothetical protein
VFAGLAAVMLTTGAVQLFASPLATDIWPWPLTPLTSHALSAWFLGVGALAALVVRENDLSRAGPAMLGSAVLGILLAVAWARYGSEVQWERPVAWLLMGLVITLVVGGVYGVLAATGAAGRIVNRP